MQDLLQVSFCSETAIYHIWAVHRCFMIAVTILQDQQNVTMCIVHVHGRTRIFETVMEEVTICSALLVGGRCGWTCGWAGADEGGWSQSACPILRGSRHKSWINIHSCIDACKQMLPNTHTHIDTHTLPALLMCRKTLNSSHSQNNSVSQRLPWLFYCRGTLWLLCRFRVCLLLLFNETVC